MCVPSLNNVTRGAPLWDDKELIWFAHSGHTPWTSESDKFVEVMVKTVLAQTQQTHAHTR